MLVAATARAGEVRVSFSNGLVTIVATDASPRQILAEWARAGQVRVTNLDRLVGGPVTLQITNVPEARALETLLRGTAGYVAAPRADSVATGSSYDRIMLLPGVAPALPAVASAPPAANPGFGRGRQPGPPTFEASANDEPEPARPMPGMIQPSLGHDAIRRPEPGPQPVPGQATMPGMPFQAPRGASVPGVLTAPPPQTKPGPTTTPTGPIKKSGGTGGQL